MQPLRVAALQLNSTEDRARNLERAEALVRRAAAEGARFVALPENFALMAREGVLVGESEDLEGPLAGWAASLARELSIELLLGSIAEDASREGMRRNTSLLFDERGALVALYRKIHLFDVELESGSLLESRVVEPGDEVVVAERPWGRLGLSICYDLRFPELYRALAARGADLLAVPSAFTAETGPHHWHLLLRARAVENQAFVVAPAEVGVHGRGRASYGHALVVDPWGEVLADAGGEDDGMAIADLDPQRLGAVRRRVPSLEHRQGWLLEGRGRRPS